MVFAIKLHYTSAISLTRKLKVIFEFQAYVPISLCPKLNWRLGVALFAARFRSY